MQHCAMQILSPLRQLSQRHEVHILEVGKCVDTRQRFAFVLRKNHPCAASFLPSSIDLP